MKRKFKFCTLLFSLTLFGTAIAGEQINGRDLGEAAPKATTTPTCVIKDGSFGNVVTTINASFFNENTYWAQSDLNGQLVFTQKFIIKTVSGCANSKQVYRFEYPEGYGATTSVPFGIIDWGVDGVCQGPAVLIVKSAAGKCKYFFNVIAEE